VSAIGNTNLVVLQECFDDFVRQWPEWAEVRGRLQRAGLDVTSARELNTGDKRSSWILLALPSKALHQAFDLAPEVLVLCAPWEIAQVNDIKRLEETFRRELRVDQGFALVIVQDTSAQARLGATIPEARRYIFVTRDRLQTEPDPQALLREMLRNELGGRRLFDNRRPATGPQFFGRAREFEALERDVRLGHCLGLYGLRKVGKTSLLRRLAGKFRQHEGTNTRVIPVELDLLAVDYKQRTNAGLIAGLRKAADEEAINARIEAPRAVSDHHGRILQLFEAAGRLGARWLFIVDEFESLLDGRFTLSDGIELLSWMRGVAQMHPERFSFVLAGRNRRLLAPARMGRIDNPMYRFLREVPLAGMADEECRTMVRRLGRRMGLAFSADALDVIMRETGGHPSLVRTLGDLVDQSVPLAARNPAQVDAAALARHLPRFGREVDDDMRELVQAAEDIEPRALERLKHLAHRVPWIGGDLEARIDDALERYGILDAQAHAFRIDRFAAWLRANYRAPVTAAHG